MSTELIFRVVCAVVGVVLLFVIVQRRRKRSR